MQIGFIGQGFIGKSYADDFEARGYTPVRYAQEKPYVENKDAVASCDIVFIAVPTPSTPQGFDASIVDEVLSLVGEGKTAVIKSTVLPGTTELLQSKHPNITVMHSPEFLTEKTAAYDAAHPDRNIIGICEDTPEVRAKAAEVISVLPVAPYAAVIPVKEAEFIKYGGNCWFYFKVLYINILFDMATELGLDWQTIKEGMAADPRIGSTHLDPVHQSGRGAGGHCFIKDFAALKELHTKLLPDDRMSADILNALERKNLALLRSTGKDLDILEGVYGKE